MKVIIAGSRSIRDYTVVQRAVETSKFTITEVVSGTAGGVDKLGEQWAKDNSKAVKQFPADWAHYGRSAGIIRNQEMAKYADALIAVWDGISNGTKHMISYMTKLKKPVYVLSTLPAELATP